MPAPQKAIPQKVRNSPITEEMRDGLEAEVVVSVLVLSRQRPTRLRALLESVLSQDFAPLEVRVLANGCAQTAALVRAEFPGVLVTETPENVGCAPGRDLLVADARGEFLVFLDDDGEVRAPDAISRMVAAA